AGGEAVVDARRVHRDRRAEAVADDADAFRIDAWLLLQPGQGIAHIRHLLEAEGATARAFALAAAAEVEAQRGVAELLQHLRRGKAAEPVLVAAEAMQHDE